METVYGAALYAVLAKVGLHRGVRYTQERYPNVALDEVLPTGICYTCWNDEYELNQTPEHADAQHARCHGWVHCGANCCGRCSHCGEED